MQVLLNILVEFYQIFGNYQRKRLSLLQLYSLIYLCAPMARSVLRSVGLIWCPCWLSCWMSTVPRLISCFFQHLLECAQVRHFVCGTFISILSRSKLKTRAQLLDAASVFKYTPLDTEETQQQIAAILQQLHSGSVTESSIEGDLAHARLNLCYSW